MNSDSAVVGGYAVMAYAEPRFTKDFDVCVNTAVEICSRFTKSLRILESLGENMKKSLIGLALLVASFLVGCGSSSDEFVFTSGDEINHNTQAGVPAQLAFVTNPAQTVDTDFSVAPIVEVQDSFGNRVPGDTTEITVSLVNPGNIILSGVTTRSAEDGRAVFPGLSVDTVGTFSLQATGGGLQVGSSANFVVGERVALYTQTSSFDSTRLLELDPTNGELIGTGGLITDDTIIGLVQQVICLPGGRLYGTAYDPDFEKILFIEVDPADPTDGTTVIAEIDDGGDILTVFGLAYDEANDVLYGLSETGSVFTIDTATGATTFPPNGHGAGFGFTGSLAFDNANGILYMSLGNNFYTVDTTTGLATQVGSVDSSSLINSMAFHPTSNVLYADVGPLFGTTGHFFGTLSPATGEFTEIAPGFSRAGFTFCRDAPIKPLTIPRETGFTITEIPQAFENINSSENALNLEASDRRLVEIGFDFDFQGEKFNELTVATDGYLSFRDELFFPAFSVDIPHSQEVDNDSLFVHWSILDPRFAGDAYVKTLGTAPNRRFVVQWNMPEADADDIGPNGNFYDFEVILYEGSNVIEYHYADVIGEAPNVSNGESAVVGLQLDNDIADLISVFMPKLTNTSAFRFTP